MNTTQKEIGFIYKIVNSVNNKCYIGQTVQNIQRRFAEHLCCAQRKTSKSYNTYFSRALRKHGKENFIISILEQCPKEMLSEREQYFISFYRSSEKEFGYNLTSGGECGKTLSRETKYKMSLSKTGNKNPRWKTIVTEETKNKISIANSGSNSSWLGRKHTEEEIDKIVNSRKKYYNEHPEEYGKWNENRKRKIICNNENKIFNSILEASKHYNVDNGKICLVCQGKRKSTNGLSFSYL